LFVGKDDHEWAKVICAALAKRNIAVGNEWLGKRLATGTAPM